MRQEEDRSMFEMNQNVMAKNQNQIKINEIFKKLETFLPPGWKVNEAPISIKDEPCYVEWTEQNIEKQEFTTNEGIDYQKKWCMVMDIGNQEVFLRNTNESIKLKQCESN